MDSVAWDVAWIGLGIAGLFLGGDRLVHGATGLARRLGLSPLVIGLTVVAFGTSAPELAATLAAALAGSPQVALGNVVGSNIANLGLILGLSALILPILSTARFLRREVPFLLGSAALMPLLLLDGRVGRVDGVLLLAGLALFLGLLLRDREPPAVEAEFEEALGGDGAAPRAGGLLRLVGWVLLGLLLLVVGARLLVLGAVSIARDLGIAERVIGLTVVAVGTSLPELASSLVAAARRQGDLVLGNVVGSNVFNVLAILGTTALVHPIAVPMASVTLDLVVAGLFSVAIWPFLSTRLALERWEGVVLLAGYGAYVGWLFLAG